VDDDLAEIVQREQARAAHGSSIGFRVSGDGIGTYHEHRPTSLADRTMHCRPPGRRLAG